MLRQRSQKGGAIAFGVVLAFVFVVLGSAFIFMSMFMGGQKEVKNAVDSGTLNVGKQALDKVTVNLDGSPGQACFDDVTTDSDSSSASRDGKVSLTRINRVWGRALMMSINAASAQADGNVGTGSANADIAYIGAKSISDSLTDKLTAENNLHQFFRDYAQSNSIRMLTGVPPLDVVPGSGWQTSLMERKKESNIVLPGAPGNNFYLPPGVALSVNDYTETTRNPPPAGSAGKYFLKGYEPITVGGKEFWTVPFLYDERPHMVARSAFDANKNSAVPLGWTKAVPNAFSAEGATTAQKATSWVLTNPRKVFNASIPRGFLHIHVDEMKCHWFFFPTVWPPIETPGTEQTYGYTTDTLTGLPQSPGGILCSMVSPSAVTVGLDAVGRSLDDIMFEPPITGTQRARLESYMVSRLNQMISKADLPQTAASLHSVLGRDETRLYLLAGQRDFYIYSPDGQSLSIKPKALALLEAPWLMTIIGNSPDGTENLVIDDETCPAPYTFPGAFAPPNVTPAPFCNFKFAGLVSTFAKDVGWRPGTGFNHCLGDVRVKRSTNLYNIGVCTPII